MCKVILQGLPIFLGGSLENTIYSPYCQGEPYTTQTQGLSFIKLYVLLFTILLDTIKINVIIRYKISDAV